MKKSLSILLALCMLVSILGGVPVYAAETGGTNGVNTHLHCLYGEYGCEVTDHGSAQLWNPTGSLPTTAGYYYLTGDVTISSTWEPVNGTFLCLNGHVVQKTGSGSVIHVNQGVSLTITDCNTNQQTHNFSVDDTGLWTLDETNGTKTVTGGVITGGTGTKCYSNSENTYGGGIYNEGTLTIYGGNIAGNTATYGGGICNTKISDKEIDSGKTFATLTINGGSICGNTANSGGGIYNSDTVTMSGGEISGNVASSNGGGVENYGGSFGMSGGSIAGNKALEGGGIDNVSSGTVTMSGGSITGNTASNNGGGVYDGYNNNVSSTVTVSGTANITDNTTGGTKNNLFLYSGKVVNVWAGFTGSIGVTTEVKPSASSPVSITTKNSADFSKRFTSDNANYNVIDVETGLTKTHRVKLSASGVTIPDAVSGAAYSASLTLTENIDINFKMKYLGTGFEKSKLTISVNGENIDTINYDEDSNTVSCVLKEVVPSELGVEWPIVVTYDGVQVKDFDYSVKDYCDAVFAAYAKDNTTYAKLNTLCEALLNYGKWAEDFVNEQTSGAGNYTASTVNADHVNDLSSYSFGEIPSGVINGTAGKAKLSLGSTITLKYYVKTDKELTNTDTATQNFYILNGSNQQIDPKRVKVEAYTQDDTYNYIVSIDLYASQLSTQYTLKLKGVDTSTFCITYGVYNYCSDAQSKTAAAFTDTLKTLCKAIHNYGVAVQEYIKNK